VVDISLLAIAALCQFATVYIGFHVTAHPPASERIRRWQVMFIFCGVLAGIAIVVTGVRSNAVQESSNKMMEEIKQKTDELLRKNNQPKCPPNPLTGKIPPLC
jgi:hypothetical protein